MAPSRNASVCDNHGIGYFVRARCRQRSTFNHRRDEGRGVVKEVGFRSPGSPTATDAPGHPEIGGNQLADAGSHQCSRGTPPLAAGIMPDAAGGLDLHHMVLRTLRRASSESEPCIPVVQKRQPSCWPGLTAGRNRAWSTIDWSGPEPDHTGKRGSAECQPLISASEGSDSLTSKRPLGAASAVSRCDAVLAVRFGSPCHVRQRPACASSHVQRLVRLPCAVPRCQALRLDLRRVSFWPYSPAQRLQ